MRSKKRETCEMAALLVILILVAAIWAKTSSPMAVRSGKLSTAGLFIDVVMPSLRADDRFREVALDVYKGNDVSILVRGSVASEADKDALIRFLDERYPPRILVFHLRILGSTDPGTGAEYYFSTVYRRDRPREPRVIVESF